MLCLQLPNGIQQRTPGETLVCIADRFDIVEGLFESLHSGFQFAISVLELFKAGITLRTVK